MEPVMKSTPQQNAAEVRIPWYWLVGAMLLVTALIIVLFAGPLNTSPNQSHQAPAAGQSSAK